MVDIFDEVEEELRAERARRLFKKYGGVMIAAAALIVLAVGAWQVWGWWQGKQDQATATRFITATTIADSAGSDKAKQQEALNQFIALAANAPEGYKTLARLRAAALEAQRGNLGNALKLWNEVAADGSAEPLLRDLASLLWAQHQIGSGNPGLVEARLKALDTPNNAWHTLAQEQLAVLDLRQGKKAAARTELRKLTQDVTAPKGVRGRAAGMLAELGG